MDESWFDGKHVGAQDGLRPAPHAGLSRVCAEPPDTDPYVRWCGTRGWLSESVTGTRLCSVEFLAKRFVVLVHRRLID